MIHTGPAELLNSMETAAREIKIWPEKKIQLYHHNDSDGLSSGAILLKSFERAGYMVRRFCLEKPYPAVLKKIFQQQGGILVFADFAGRIAPMISELNRGRNLTVILDHHVAEPATDPRVYNLNPELYGIKGDLHASASTTCFLFALKMDSANQDLAHIATIGAVGDGFFENGRLVGQNRTVLAEAVDQGTVVVRENPTGESYVINFPKGSTPCEEVCKGLDLFGAAGFYQNGPDMGIQVCLEGFSPDTIKMAENFRYIQESAFHREIGRIKRWGLKKTAHIQWFHVKDRFSPMGVKMIGAFCNTVKDMQGIDPKKYIAGFQIIPDSIPGFGVILLPGVKISMRVPSVLQADIRTGKIMGLDAFLPQATDRLGGFSDACHSLAAATTIDIGKEENLIQEMENILANQKSYN